VEAVGEAVGHRLYAFPVPVLAYAAAAGAAEAFGRISNRAMVFTADKVREMEQKAWVCSGASLTADTGWRPRMSIKEGAALTYGWYQENGWL
jgi:nucleoside-diphosphate-sugar epimerase